MRIEDQIKKSEQLIQWMDACIGEPTTSSDIRSRLSGTCLAVAREHQKAIVLLIANQLCGSAYALVRAQFESYVRGTWLHHCALDSDLERFQADKLKRSFASLVADIEKHPGFEDGYLSAVTRKSWDAMCSYAHTGSLQMARWNTEDEIGHNYKEDELVEVIDYTNALAILASIGIALLAKDDALASRLLAKGREL